MRQREIKARIDGIPDIKLGTVVPTCWKLPLINGLRALKMPASSGLLPFVPELSPGWRGQAGEWLAFCRNPNVWFACRTPALPRALLEPRRPKPALLASLRPVSCEATHTYPHTPPAVCFFPLSPYLSRAPHPPPHSLFFPVSLCVFVVSVALFLS